MDTPPLFKDRSHAGKLLAEKLLPYASGSPLILALPRGGVPVAYEVAVSLNAPLDTVVARKIGAPSNPEFGVGAVAPGDVIMINEASLRSLGISEGDLDPIIESELQEMDNRILRYKSGEYSENVRADTVILVDDGLATGVTARAAIESVRLLNKPGTVIFAAPICAADTAAMLEGMVDELVCLHSVKDLVAIGHWYENFEQVSDEEVIHYLDKIQTRASE